MQRKYFLVIVICDDQLSDMPVEHVCRPLDAFVTEEILDLIS